MHHHPYAHMHTYAYELVQVHVHRPLGEARTKQQRLICGRAWAGPAILIQAALSLQYLT